MNHELVQLIHGADIIQFIKSGRIAVSYTHLLFQAHLSPKMTILHNDGMPHILYKFSVLKVFMCFFGIIFTWNTPNNSVITLLLIIWLLKHFNID